MSLLLAWAALSGMASPLGAAAVSPQVVAAPSSHALAMGVEVARLLNPEQLTLASSDAMIRTMLQRKLIVDSNILATEKLHPGFIAAASEAIRSTTLAIMKDRLPLLWNRMGAVYAESLSEAELQQTLAFYQSAAGLRIVQAALKGVDPTALIDKQIADPNRKVIAAELNEALSASATSAVKAATSEDRSVLYNFVFTPLGGKIRELNPRMLRIAADWANKRDPADEKRITDATGAAMAPFLAPADPPAKKAKR